MNWQNMVASPAIATLLKTGKVVGVSSNSHKAIAHLLGRAAEVATKKGVGFNAGKVQSDPAAFMPPMLRFNQ